MSAKDRYRIIGGVFLILIGGLLIAPRLIPELKPLSSIFSDWPMVVITVGVCLFVFGLLVNAPQMAVPACIVSGIGGILLYQNNTGYWESWSFAWALIPGFVGIGILISSLLEGKLKQEFSSGIWLIFISAVMFIIFGAMLGGVYIFGDYWPVLLILLGLWIIGRGFFGRK